MGRRFASGDFLEKGLLTMTELFGLSDAGPCVIRGAAIVSAAPRLAHLAIKMGFDTVWAELEHGHIGYDTAELLCRAAESGGGFGTLRISGVKREFVLRALEVGARIVIAPMVSTVAQARELVCHGKFPPVGSRGYNSRSPGMHYGLGSPTDLMVQVNAETHLIAQIETQEAVSNLDGILDVEGLSGILIGPADLSVDMGMPLQFTDPKVIDTVTTCIGKARRAGKVGGIMAGPGPLLDAVIDAGANLIYYAGDIMDLAVRWRELLELTESRVR